jgi:hypothetical protein
MAQVKVLTKRIAVPRTSIGSDGTFEDLAANNKGVLKYEVMMGSSDVKNFRDGDDFYPFDGKGDSFRNEVFPDKDEFSCFTFLGMGKPSQKQKERWELKKAKKAAKTDLTMSQAELNRNIGKDKQSDIELAKALQEKGGDEQKGMSTGAIIGIAVGSLALIGIIIFVVKSRGAKSKAK